MENGYGDPLIFQKLALRDGLKCYYCGFEFSKTMEGWNNMTADHVKPQKESGSDHMDNPVLSCEKLQQRQKRNDYAKGFRRNEVFSETKKTITQSF